jgi:hypothetical protein
MAQSFDVNVFIGSEIGYTIQRESPFISASGIPEIMTIKSMDDDITTPPESYTIFKSPRLVINDLDDFITTTLVTSTYQTVVMTNIGNATLTITNLLSANEINYITPIIKFTEPNVLTTSTPITILPGNTATFELAYYGFPSVYDSEFFIQSNSVDRFYRVPTHIIVNRSKSWDTPLRSISTTTTQIGKKVGYVYAITPMIDTFYRPDIGFPVYGNLSGSPAWSIVNSGTNFISVQFNPNTVNNVNGTYTSTMIIRSVGNTTATVFNSATIDVDHTNNKNLSSWLSPAGHFNSIIGMSYDLINGTRNLTIGVGNTSGVLAVTTTTIVPDQLYAGSFNGSTKYLTVSGAPAISTSSFTIEAWVYPDAAVGIGTIASWGGDGGAFRLFLSTDTPDIQIWTGGSPLIQQSITNPINQWSHIAVQRDNLNLVTVYINGSIVNQTTLTTNWNYVGDLIIGADLAGGSFFSGYISNFRYVLGTAVYTSAFTLPTGPLTATQSANANGNPSNALTAGQTQVLTLQTATIIDSSSYGLSITNYDAVATSLQSVLSSYPGPLDTSVYVTDLGLGREYDNYPSWSKVYRIPISTSTTSTVYYSNNHVVKTTATTTVTDYSVYFGENDSVGSMFIIESIGYGSVRVKMNNLTADLDLFATYPNYDDWTLKNLTQAFYYYANSDVTFGRYSPLPTEYASPRASNSSTTYLFLGFDYNNKTNTATVKTSIVPIPT